MLAQKSSAEIFAVEMENGALTDAAKNFETSIWKERLHLLPGDIRQMSLQHNMDFIICNPPFYDQALEPESEHRKMSMHSVTLSFQNLVEIAGRLLSPHGSFAVMTPYFRRNEFLHMMEKNRFILQKYATSGKLFTITISGL
jgi:tRNA1Val (adenine37-N6)-methyltransferase